MQGEIIWFSSKLFLIDFPLGLASISITSSKHQISFWMCIPILQVGVDAANAMVIGRAKAVTIQTLHGEMNAIDAKNRNRAEAEATVADLVVIQMMTYFYEYISTPDLCFIIHIFILFYRWWWRLQSWSSTKRSTPWKRRPQSIPTTWPRPDAGWWRSRKWP